MVQMEPLACDSTKGKALFLEDVGEIESHVLKLKEMATLNEKKLRKMS